MISDAKAADWDVAASASPERSPAEPPQAITKIMLNTETVDASRMVTRIGKPSCGGVGDADTVDAGF